ncbi:MAG: hypothetical protein AAGD11_20930 [Planctomycetota bacterium]
MTNPELFKVFSEVVDDIGNRLSLRFVEVPRAKRWEIPGVTVPDYTGYDFHSLVWDAKHGSAWQRKATITQAEFEQNGTQRWVSDLHSLDARYGSAVIKVAEGEWRVTYSWRQWDVLSNKEIRLIRVCECPFESFDVLEDSQN